MTRLCRYLAVAAMLCLALGAHAQSGILDANNFNQWILPQGTSPAAGSISWNPVSACTVTSAGYQFVAAKVGRPIMIVDANPANSEIIIPTTVALTGNGCVLQATMQHIHYAYHLISGTFGLQEALDYGTNVPQSVVSVGPSWSHAGGTTNLITSAKGSGNISILDQRSSLLQPYTWNGSAFVATPFPGSGGALFPGTTGPVCNASTTTAHTCGSSDAGSFPTLNQNTTGTSGNLSGTPALPNGVTATTQTAGDNSTKLATDAFVLANAGVGSVTNQANGVIPLATAPGAIGAQSPIDVGNTTPGVVTSTDPIAAPSVSTGGPSNGGVLLTSIGTLPAAESANQVQLTVPNSVTHYTMEYPPAQPSATDSGFYSCSAGNPTVCSFKSSIGTWIMPEMEPSSCTFSSVSYTGQTACGFQKLKAAGGGGLFLGAAIYQTDSHCLVEPTLGGQVSIVGISSSGNGSPTTIQSNGCAGPVISHPVLTTGQSLPYGLVLANFNIDANNTSTSCAELYAERIGYAAHIQCRNFTDPDHAWKWGNEAPGTGNIDGSYQFNQYDIGIQQITSPATSWANVTVSGSTPSFTVVSGGSYTGVVNGTVTGYLVGTPNGNISPCSTPGVTTATITAGVLSAPTSTASGCAGTYYAKFPDTRPTANMFVIAGTDSKEEDIVTQGGAVGIKYLHGGNTCDNCHPIEAAIGIQNMAPNDFTNIKLDSSIVAGFDYEDSNSSISQIKSEWNVTGAGGYDGSIDFYFGTSPNRAYIAAHTCGPGAITFPGYHQFASSTGSYSEAPAMVYPTGFTLLADTNCDNLFTTTWYGSIGFGAAYLNGTQLAVPNNAIMQFSNGAAVTMTAAGNNFIRTGGISVLTSNPGTFGIAAPFAGTAKNLKVTLSGTIGTGNSVAFTVWDGNTAEPLTCTMAAAASFCSDTTHTFAVTALDTLTLDAVCTGTCGASTIGALLGTIQIQ